MQGHGEQSAQGVNAAEVQGATWVHPVRQALHGMHTVSLAVPQAVWVKWPAEHTVQGLHWVALVLVHRPVTYHPAAHPAHGSH